MRAPEKPRAPTVKKNLVGIVMGSTSDWEVMQHAARSLADFGIAYEARALSAHRSPDALVEWVEGLAQQGAKCFIAGAGGAAHLAGVVAAKTALPVLAVPMPSKHLQGLDSLLSMVQMPKGIPVATFAIGEAGAANAGLFAVAMLALEDAALAKKLADFRKKQADAVLAARLPELK
ncbi:MAG TPA: 5-(carboxyamino)imidazole ribonucleotide mutase [Burkholderiales bacterium]|jgi:5-(carboxyamino)imidazole ribonucleotide mutase